MKKALIIFTFFTISQLTAQKYILDSVKTVHQNLINLEANRLKFASESPYFNAFFKQLDSVYEGKKDNLHIFHIGGSHIQADIYSNKLRTYLQNSNEVSMGQRGFVFPYHLAHTNNPVNYRITATKDKWQGYRCSVTKDSVTWGLSGVTAAFRGVSDTVHIQANYKNYTKQPYTFNKLRVFYNSWKEDYHLTLMNDLQLISDTINYDAMYREFQFDTAIEELSFCLQLKDTTTVAPEFLFMGLELMNDNPGIQYTSIGVNGASFAFYNRSAYFEQQLQLYKPDLFIISIGTNDAYMPKAEFKPEKFRMYYEAFIQMIQRANPDCAILLTVPNDSYYQRKIPNPNTATQQQIINELAVKYQMAVWDFYDIMGGLGSSNKWYKQKLMPRDRIHFTNLGYHIKADLLLTALIESWATAANRDKDTLLNYYKTLDE